MTGNHFAKKRILCVVLFTIAQNYPGAPISISYFFISL